MSVDDLDALLVALQLGKPVALPPGTLLLVDDEEEPRAVVDVGDVTVLRTLGGGGPVAVAVDDGGSRPLWVLARQVQRVVSIPPGTDPTALLTAGTSSSTAVSGGGAQ